MGLAQSNEEHYTYGDYAKWTDAQRWELIDGVPYAMTPAPTTGHQRTVRRLLTLLSNFLDEKPCEVFAAPTDVILADLDEADENVETVLQPDLLVVCDPAKIEEKGIRGAPDLTIEILSDSTAARDLGEKLALYEKHGVRCYIIVDPWSRTCTLREMGPDAKFAHPEIYAVGDAMPIRIFPELMIDLARLFA